MNYVLHFLFLQTPVVSAGPRVQFEMSSHSVFLPLVVQPCSFHSFWHKYVFVFRMPQTNCYAQLDYIITWCAQITWDVSSLQSYDQYVDVYCPVNPLCFCIREVNRFNGCSRTNIESDMMETFGIITLSCRRDAESAGCRCLSCEEFRAVTRLGFMSCRVLTPSPAPDDGLKVKLLIRLCL